MFIIRLNQSSLLSYQEKRCIFVSFFQFSTSIGLYIFNITFYSEVLFFRILNFSQFFNSHQSNFLIIASIIINKPNKNYLISGHCPRLRYPQPSSPILHFSKLLKDDIFPIFRVKAICFYTDDGSLCF